MCVGVWGGDVCGCVCECGGGVIRIDDQSSEHVWLLTDWLQLYIFYLVVSYLLNFILLTFNYSLYLLLVCKLPLTTYLSDASYCDRGLVRYSASKDQTYYGWRMLPNA